MTLIKCTVCGCEISDRISKCHKCGHQTGNESPIIKPEIQKQKIIRHDKKTISEKFTQISGVVAILLACVLVFYVVPVRKIYESVTLSSFSFFDNKEKKAIELVKGSKIQFDSENAWASLFLGVVGLGQGATWQDFSNTIVKQKTNKKFKWSAEKTKESGLFLVAFADEEGWGHRWEVNIEQQTVNLVNQNEYLSRKYGLSRFDSDSNFEIVSIETDTLKVEKLYNYYSDKSSKKIVYILKAKAKNKTGKIITDAKISGKLTVIFKDKTIEGESGYESGFKTNISLTNPWNPNMEKLFYIKTNGIDQIYLSYQPEYVFFEVGIKAEDPIGYKYDKNIQEFDLKNKWKNLK